MESLPQNPEFRNNPENFHPWPWTQHICDISSVGQCPILQEVDGKTVYAKLRPLINIDSRSVPCPPKL